MISESARSTSTGDQLRGYLNATFSNCARQLSIVAAITNASGIYGPSFIVGDPLVYSANASLADCSTGDSSFYSTLSHMGPGPPCPVIGTEYCPPRWPANDSCYDRANPSCSSGSCQSFNDPKLGIIPVDLLRNLTSASVSVDRSVAGIGVVALLYSPSHSMYTILRLRFDIDQNGIVHPDYSLNTFKDLSGDRWHQLLTLIAVCLAGAVVITDIIHMIPYRLPGDPGQCQWDRRRSGKLNSVYSLITSVLATLLCGFKYFYLFHPDWRSTISALLNSAKLENAKFIEPYTSVLAAESSLDIFRGCTVGLLFLVLSRVVLLLSIHPRMAMITETFWEGASDFLHFLLVYITLLLGFAFVYVLLFSDQLYYASTFARAVFVQFQFLMGSWSFADFNHVRNYSLFVLYVVLFGVVMLFTGLYFILALVICAHDKYLRNLELYSAARGLPGDIWLLFVQSAVGVWNRWPSRSRLVSILVSGDSELVTVDQIVSVAEVVEERRAKHMVEWYVRRFDFGPMALFPSATVEESAAKLKRKAAACMSGARAAFAARHQSQQLDAIEAILSAVELELMTVARDST